MEVIDKGIRRMKKKKEIHYDEIILLTQILFNKIVRSCAFKCDDFFNKCYGIEVAL